MIYIIIFYLLSAALMWRYNHLAYSKRGTWHLLKPTVTDLIFTLIPIVNTLACIVVWLFHYPIKNKEKDFSKFFNIKN